MKKLIDKFMNREVIAYLIAGVLTTLVNIIVYYLLRRLIDMDVLWANGIAWFLSVLFAFVVNDRFVFIQEKQKPAQELAKMTKFFAARLFSFALDEGGMWLLVKRLLVHDLIAKIIMNVIVIIINYIFSKLFIFRTAQQKPDQGILDDCQGKDSV